MSKQINKLIKEQENMIPVYFDEYYKATISTTPSNAEKLIPAFNDLCKYHKLKKPEIFRFSNPFDGAKFVAQSVKGSENVSQAEIKEAMGQAVYGSHESYWVSMYAFITEQLGVKDDGLVAVMKTIVQESGLFWVFEDAVVWCDKPSILNLKDGVVTGGVDSYAIGWPDGTGFYTIDKVPYRTLLEAELALASGVSKKK